MGAHLMLLAEFRDVSVERRLHLSALLLHQHELLVVVRRHRRVVLVVLRLARGRELLLRLLRRERVDVDLKIEAGEEGGSDASARRSRRRMMDAPPKRGTTTL